MTALTVYLCHKIYRARNSFTTRGQILILECLLRAAFHRCLFIPLKRFVRIFLNSQQPMYLNDFKDSIGQQWLTNVLQQGKHATGNVTDVQVLQFAAGQTGLCARLTITYEKSKESTTPARNEANITASTATTATTATTAATAATAATTSSLGGQALGPSSMVVKMSRPDTIGKVLNMMARLYSECHMYVGSLPSMVSTIPTPKYYYVNVDPLSKDFLLLLEDGSNVGYGARVENACTLREYSEITDKRAKTSRGRELRRMHWSIPESMTEHHPNTRVDRVSQVLHYMKRASKSIASLHARYWMDEQVWKMDVHFATMDNVSKGKNC